MKFHRPESEHAEEELPEVKEEDLEAEIVKQLEEEDLSKYNLGDLTCFAIPIRLNLEKVQKRVNKDKIVLEQFPYWDRYID